MSASSSEIPSEGPPLMHVDSNLSTKSGLYMDDGNTGVDDTKPKKEREPTSFQLTNPARLVPSQMRFISLNADQRYVPVSRRVCAAAGIVMLIDCDPAAPENVVKVERIFIGQGDEADAPEPFDWDPSLE